MELKIMRRQKLLLDFIFKLNFYQSFKISTFQNSFYRPTTEIFSLGLFKYLQSKNETINKSMLPSPSFISKFQNQKSFSNLSDVKCWNCKQYLERKKFTCSFCGALQNPQNNINYYELFEISQIFDINLEELSSKFKSLQILFHPDKFMNKSKKELEISETYSSLVNKAYAILKDPVKRGFYLLELRNQSIEDFPVEQEFLMSIMEKNEELENISVSNLEMLKKANSEEISKQLNLISESFNYNKWREAKCNLIKLNYFINLQTKIKEKEAQANNLE